MMMMMMMITITLQNNSLVISWIALCHIRFLGANWKWKKRLTTDLTRHDVNAALHVVHMSNDILSHNIRPILVVLVISQQWRQNLEKQYEKINFITLNTHRLCILTADSWGQLLSLHVRAYWHSPVKNKDLFPWLFIAAVSQVWCTPTGIIPKAHAHQVLTPVTPKRHWVHGQTPPLQWSPINFCRMWCTATMTMTGLSIHDSCSLHLRQLPSTVPCSMIFCCASWRHTGPNHDNLRRLTADNECSWHLARIPTCCHTYSSSCNICFQRFEFVSPDLHSASNSHIHREVLTRWVTCRV